MTASSPDVAPDWFMVLAPSDKFLRSGFWKPGMQRLHGTVWDTLKARGLRFWSDITREILVHPEDLWQATLVLRDAEQQTLAHSS